MISAIDTNVLLDILIPDQKFSDVSTLSLMEAAATGALVISDIVYAELCRYSDTQRLCDEFLADNAIRVEALTRESMFLASRAWRRYRAQGGKRERILPDFLIGAHAQIQADRLLSRDRGFYGSLFPSLNVVDPSKS